MAKCLYLGKDNDDIGIKTEIIEQNLNSDDEMGYETENSTVEQKNTKGMESMDLIDK